MADSAKNLWVVISAKTEGLRQGLAEVNKDIGKSENEFKNSFGNITKSLQSAGKVMAGFGATITGAFALGIKSTVDLGSELSDLSSKTGMSADFLSALKYAAEQSGASLDTFETAVKQMNNVLVDATDGSKAANEALGGIGLTWEDLEGMNPEEIFSIVAQKISEIENPALKSALAMDIFGKSGTDMLPMLVNGAGGITDLTQKAQSLGLTMSQNTAVKLDDFGDSLDTLKTSFMMTIASGVMPLIDALKPLLEKIMEGIAKFGEWTAAHPELTNVLVIVAAAIGVVSTVIGTLIMVLPTLIAGITALGTVITIATGPVGLIALAIAGVIAVGILLVTNWETIQAKTIEIWNAIGEFFANLWENITNLFQTKLGFILAALVPFIGIPLLIISNWDTIKAFFVELWNNVTATLTAAWDAILAYLTGLWNTVLNLANTIWTAILTAITLITDTISTTITTIWDAIYAYLSMLWETIRGLADTVWNAILTVITTITTNISTTINEIWDAIYAYLSGIWETISGAAETAWNAILTTITDITTNISTAISTLWDEISTYLSGILETISTNFNTKWNEILSFLSEIWTTISTLATTLWTAILDFINPIFDKVQSIWSPVWEGVKTALNTVWEGIKTLWDNTLGPKVKLIENIWSNLKSVWSKAWNAVKDMVMGIINTIIKAMQPIASLLGYNLQQSKNDSSSAEYTDDYLGNELGDGTYSYASGGLAYHPQIATLAEHEPEAILPLDLLKNIKSGNNVNIVINNPSVRNNNDIDLIGESLVRRLRSSGLKL